MRFSVESRKKYVIELREKKHTVREIADELRMSPRDIEKILKEHEREEKERRDIEIIENEENEKKRIFLSKRSKALQLYKKGPILLDVAIELEISAAEANSFYDEYCALQYPPQFLEIYRELNDTNSFKPFIELFHLVKEGDLKIEDLIDGVKKIKDIPSLEENYDFLSDNIKNFQMKQDYLISETNYLSDLTARKEEYLNCTVEKIIQKEKNLENLREKEKQTEERIYKLNSGENYEQARGQIKLLVGEILSNKKKIIALAVSSVFAAVKEKHENEIRLDLTNFVDEFVLNNSDNDVYREKLQDSASRLWDSISDMCISDFINNSAKINPKDIQI